MERLLQADPDVLSPFEALQSSHHHPSVRLAAMLSKIQELRRSHSDAVPRDRQALLSTDLPLAHSSPRMGPLAPLSTNYLQKREEYFRWFDDFMAPRNEVRLIGDYIWKKYPALESKPTKQEARLLLQESLERINSLSLSKAEKIERSLEILTVFYKFSPNNSFPLPPEELNRLFKKLAFSSAEPWDPHGVIELFSKRTNDYDWGFRNHPRKTLRALTRTPTILSVFGRYAAASPKWRQFIDALYGSNTKLTAIEFRDLIEDATQNEWSEAHAKALIQKLDHHSFEEAYNEEFGIHDVKSTLALQATAEAPDCKNLACTAIAKFLVKQHEEFKLRLRRRFDELLAHDPASLDLPTLKSHVNELANTFVIQQSPLLKTKRTPLGLKPQDLVGLGSKLWKWSEVAEDRLKNEKVDVISIFSKSFIQRNAAATIVAELSAAPSINDNAIALYKKVRPYVINAAEDAFAKRLFPQTLRSLIMEQPIDLLDSPELLSNIASFTRHTPEGVKAIGLTWDLFEKLRGEPTPPVNPEDEERRKKLGEQIREQLKEQLRRFEKLRVELLKDPYVAKSISPVLTQADLESITRAYRYKHEIESLAEAFTDPSVLAKGRGRSKMKTRARELELHLIDLLINQQKRGINIEKWAGMLRDVLEFGAIELISIPLEKRTQLGKFLNERIQSLTSAEQMRLLENTTLLHILGEEHAGERLAKSFVATLPPDLPRTDMASSFRDLQSRLDLKKSHPEANRIFETRVAETLNLQPGEAKLFFPEDPKKIDWANFSGHIRGGSAMVAQVQQLSASEQLDFIDYVTGRREKVPPCVSEMALKVAKIDSALPFEDFVMGLKAKFSSESTLMRSLALLPLFTGSTSILRRPGGLDVLLDRIFKNVSPANQDLARELARGILKGEGNNAPFAFAMIFGQRTNDSRELGEAEILQSLFQAYGVPGTKFGQYLGFTSELKALALLQDQAMPLSYLEAVRLLETKFPNGLPEGFRVIRIRGSGSVNIGIEFYNPISKKNEIFTVTREAIEVATTEDFRRLRGVILELTKTAIGNKRFGFMLGLDEIIQRSVELEFDRAQVFRNHAELSKIIRGSKYGWKIKMVEPYAIENGVIRMEMAQGTPARLVEEQNPKLYKSAMRAASETMLDHLLREDDTAKRGLRHFADSDFHNGQAFIDEKTKTVYLFDPGQSIAIDKNEFEHAKTILRILSGVLDINSGARFIEDSRLLNPSGKTGIITDAELARLLEGRQPADAFIKLVAHIKQRGGDLPLPVVQWVLGMNRQIALSKKLGFSIERRFLKTFLIEKAKELAHQTQGCLNEAIAHVLKTIRP